MHLSGASILVLFTLLALAAMLLLLHLTQLGHIIHVDIPDRPRRRLFLAAVSFFVTFLGARLLVWCIVHDVGPFHWVTMGGRHIHHLVWGILILLSVGYGWLAEIDHGSAPSRIFVARSLALLYGAGAALTLDEFALWFNLEDVYWAREGRESIDAVLLFGSLLAIAIWGAPLFTRLAKLRRAR